MAIANYANPSTRTGRAKRNIVKHAIHRAVLEKSGEVWKQPVNAGETVDFRQVVPFGATVATPNVFTTTAAAHLIQEGNTPPPDSLVTLDFSVTVQKYGALYGYTERQKTLGENDIPQWMEEQLGERLGLVRELIYIGALQGCTNRFYSGGAARASVSAPVNLNILNRIIRNLAGNHAEFVTTVLSPSQNYGTNSIQRSYIAYGHTDLQQDIEAIPGYTKVTDYGQMTKVDENELGSVNNIRFVLSPDFPRFINAGAAVAATGNVSTGGAFADVYQLFVIAKNAWGHTSFRGIDAFDLSHIPVSQKDKSDPTGERGYVSGTFYDAAVVTNHGWMAVAEVTASGLTA